MKGTTPPNTVAAGWPGGPEVDCLGGERARSRRAETAALSFAARDQRRERTRPPGGRLTVYLEADDDGVRRSVEKVASEVAPGVALQFQVTGPFRAS